MKANFSLRQRSMPSSLVRVKADSSAFMCSHKFRYTVLLDLRKARMITPVFNVPYLYSFWCTKSFTDLIDTSRPVGGRLINIVAYTSKKGRVKSTTSDLCLVTYNGAAAISTSWKRQNINIRPTNYADNTIYVSSIV